jgi:hypothetical protein
MTKKPVSWATERMEAGRVAASLGCAERTAKGSPLLLLIHLGSRVAIQLPLAVVYDLAENSPSNRGFASWPAAEDPGIAAERGRKRGTSSEFS